MRIAGINIPDNKQLKVALTSIYGIGLSRAESILEKLNLDEGKRAKMLSSAEENSLRQAVEDYRVEGALKRETSGNIKRLIEISAYRGLRHSKRLPVRGQRTKTNSRTRRGNVRHTMTSGRRKVEKK